MNVNLVSILDWSLFCSTILITSSNLCHMLLNSFTKTRQSKHSKEYFT